MSNNDEVLYQGQFARLKRRGRWEFVERVNCSGVAVIIAITAQQQVVLVEQYREAVQSLVLELPAGLVGDGDDNAKEAPIESARRELLEETGFEASEMKAVFAGPSSPGLVAEVPVFYLATGLTKIAAGGGVDGENISVHTVAFSEVHQWLERQQQQRGVLVDPKLYMGLWFAQQLLNLA